LPLVGASLLIALAVTWAGCAGVFPANRGALQALGFIVLVEVMVEVMGLEPTTSTLRT
jgi:hypothetical protein